MADEYPSETDLVSERIDFWSLSSMGDQKLIAYVKYVEQYQKSETERITRTIATSSIAVSALLWLAYDQIAMSNNLKAYKIMLIAVIVWLLFWCAISISRLFPYMISPLYKIEEEYSLASISEKSTRFATKREWETHLRTLLTALAWRERFSAKAYSVGIFGATIGVMAVGASYVVFELIGVKQ